MIPVDVRPVVGVDDLGVGLSDLPVDHLDHPGQGDRVQPLVGQPTDGEPDGEQLADLRAAACRDAVCSAS